MMLCPREKYRYSNLWTSARRISCTRKQKKIWKLRKKLNRNSKKRPEKKVKPSLLLYETRLLPFRNSLVLFNLLCLLLHTQVDQYPSGCLVLLKQFTLYLSFFFIRPFFFRQQLCADQIITGNTGTYRFPAGYFHKLRECYLFFFRITFLS